MQPFGKGHGFGLFNRDDGLVVFHRNYKSGSMINKPRSSEFSIAKNFDRQNG